MVNKKIKTAFSALLAAIAVMCFSVAFVPARADAAAAEANDFSAANGGLESADGALPEGWYFKEKSTVAVDTEVYAEGKNSLRNAQQLYCGLPDEFDRTLSRGRRQNVPFFL